MQFLALAVALCVALAYAEPDPEAWGGYGGYGGGYRSVGVYRDGFRRGFGGKYYGRKKRSADPEPVAEPAAELGLDSLDGFRRYYGGRGGYRNGFSGHRGGFGGFRGGYEDKNIFDY